MVSLRKLEFRLPGADYLMQLLPVLSGLQQLQELYLHFAAPPAEAVAAAAPAFAAGRIKPLQHLTRLQQLKLRGPLPAGLGDCLFPAEQQLPQLTCLSLEAWAQQQQDGAAAGLVRQPLNTSAFAAADSLQRMASCCPSLNSLAIAGALSSNAAQQLYALQRLAGLKHLSIGGTSVDDAAAQQVAGLVQLQRLVINGSPQLTDAGLLWLGRMRGLALLQVKGCGLSQALMPVADADHMPMLKLTTRQADSTLGSQVCQQLLVQLYKHSQQPGCLKLLLQEQLRVVAAQAAKQQLQQLQQRQLQQQQAQIEQQQVQLEQLQAQLQQQQQQVHKLVCMIETMETLDAFASMCKKFCDAYYR